MNPAHDKFNGFTIEETFILKWQYSFPFGGFATTFIKAALLADDENLGRLAQGFPAEIRALRRYWHEEGWWPSLEKRALRIGIVPRKS